MSTATAKNHGILWLRSRRTPELDLRFAALAQYGFPVHWVPDFATALANLAGKRLLVVSDCDEFSLNNSANPWPRLYSEVMRTGLPWMLSIERAQPQLSELGILNGAIDLCPLDLELSAWLERLTALRPPTFSAVTVKTVPHDVQVKVPVRVVWLGSDRLRLNSPCWIEPQTRFELNSFAFADRRKVYGVTALQSLTGFGEPSFPHAVFCRLDEKQAAAGNAEIRPADLNLPLYVFTTAADFAQRAVTTLAAVETQVYVRSSLSQLPAPASIRLLLLDAAQLNDSRGNSLAHFLGELPASCSLLIVGFSPQERDKGQKFLDKCLATPHRVSFFSSLDAAGLRENIQSKIHNPKLQTWVQNHSRLRKLSSAANYGRIVLPAQVIERNLQRGSLRPKGWGAGPGAWLQIQDPRASEQLRQPWVQSLGGADVLGFLWRDLQLPARQTLALQVQQDFAGVLAAPMGVGAPAAVALPAPAPAPAALAPRADKAGHQEWTFMAAALVGVFTVVGVFLGLVYWLGR